MKGKKLDCNVTLHSWDEISPAEILLGKIDPNLLYDVAELRSFMSAHNYCFRICKKFLVNPEQWRNLEKISGLNLP